MELKLNQARLRIEQESKYLIELKILILIITVLLLINEKYSTIQV